MWGFRCRPCSCVGFKVQVQGFRCLNLTLTPICEFIKILPLILILITILFCVLKSSKFLACGAAGIHWVNGSSNLQFCPQIPLCEFIEILPLILAFIAKSLLHHFCAKILKIFACGGHSLGQRTYSSALKPHFVNSLKYYL